VYSSRLPTVPLGRRPADRAGHRLPAAHGPLSSGGLAGLHGLHRLRGGRRQRGARGLLGRYLAAVGVLLGLTVTLAPRPVDEQTGPPSAHQVEVIQVDGGGLNVVTRTAMRGTAWTSALAVERQRDLLAPSPLMSRVLGPLAVRFSAWRDTNRTRLATSVITTVTMLIFYGVLGRPVRRSWAQMVLLLLIWSGLATYPQTALRAVSLPGQATTRLLVELVGQSSEAGGQPATLTQGRLGDEFWTAFVTQPYSRVQTGSAVLAQAPPHQRTGLLGALREQVAAIGRRAGGGAAVERALTATVALGSAVPFSAAIAACSVAGWVAQSLLLLLCLTVIALAPVLLLDARARLLLVRWWVMPLLGALALAALAVAGSLGITWLAITLAGMGEAAARMFTGSAFALGSVLLAGWRVRRWARGLTAVAVQHPAANHAGVSATEPGSEASVA
jgi:hypothetical protein